MKPIKVPHHLYKELVHQWIDSNSNGTGKPQSGKPVEQKEAARLMQELRDELHDKATNKFESSGFLKLERG